MSEVKLPHRKLGDLNVTGIGMGIMNIVHAYGPPINRKDAINLVRHAYEAGIQFFDTAEIYGPFTAEEIAGEALAPIRDKVIICTKFGFEIDKSGKVLGLNSKPEHIKKVCEESLKRLRTDHIDLLYQHRIDPQVPIEEVASAVQELIKEGKVKHFGLSGAGAATIRRAHSVQKVTAVENQYSYWEREQEPEVLPICEELGIGFVPYSPLGMGYLSGKITPETQLAESDLRASFPRFTVEARRNNWEIIKLLQKVGDSKGATPAQIALSWLLHQKPWIVPIFGTTKIAHVDENIKALNVKLSTEDLNILEDGFSKFVVTGKSSGENQLKNIDIGAKAGTSSSGTHGLSPLPKK